MSSFADRLAAIDADLDHWAPGTDHDTDSPAARAYAEVISRVGLDHDEAVEILRAALRG